MRKQPSFIVAAVALLWLWQAPGLRAEDASAEQPAVGGTAPAAQQSALGNSYDSLKKMFLHWKQGLEKTAVEGRYRKTRSISVAAVRGDLQGLEDPTLPYWKGTWSAKKTAERDSERQELVAAVDLLLAGKPDDCAAALDAFQKAHPYSTMAGDVSEARAKLAEIRTQVTAAAPAPEKPEAAEQPKTAAPGAAGGGTAPAEPAKAEPPQKPAQPIEAAKAAEPAKPEVSAKPAEPAKTPEAGKTEAPDKPAETAN